MMMLMMSYKTHSSKFLKESINSNKIVKNINALINERRIGCLDKTLMADGLFNLKLRPQNKHLDVMREVEKLAYTILNKLNRR